MTTTSEKLTRYFTVVLFAIGDSLFSIEVGGSLYEIQVK